MKHSVALTAAIATLGLVGAASAADMPTKAPIVRAPMAAVYNWTGCYIGANAGWIGGADKFTNYPGGTGVPATAVANSVTSHESGFTGGGQVGCNWQGAASPFVYGIEADFNGSSLKESASVDLPFAFGGFIARTETNTERLTWFSTLRGRAGYAMDRWLVYATGGLAVAHINSSFTWVDTGVPLLRYAGSDSRTRVGYTVGAGVEYAFNNNWSAKVEYLYLDFGTFTFVSPNQLGATIFWNTDVHARDHVVRVGLNYKLN